MGPEPQIHFIGKAGRREFVRQGVKERGRRVKHCGCTKNLTIPTRTIEVRRKPGIQETASYSCLLEPNGHWIRKAPHILHCHAQV